MKKILLIILCGLMAAIISNLCISASADRGLNKLDSFLLENPEVLPKDTSVTMDIKRLRFSQGDVFNDTIIDIFLRQYLNDACPEVRKLLYARLITQNDDTIYYVRLVTPSEHHPFAIADDTIKDVLGYIGHDSLYVLLDKSFRSRTVTCDEPPRRFKLSLLHHIYFDERIEWWFRQDSSTLTLIVPSFSNTYWYDDATIDRLCKRMSRMDEHEF